MFKDKEDGAYCGRWCCRGGHFSWGVILFFIGIFLLAREMGWIAVQVSFWPVFLIAFGLYLIIRKF